MTIVANNTIALYYERGSKLPDQRVRCADCHVTIFEIRNGMMLLLATHHGERHSNVVRLIAIDKEDSS